MNYIEPITDPKILKLGFGSMALYKKPWPQFDLKYYHISSRNQILEVWEQSFITYLKEQEFKVREIVYWDKGERRHIIEEVLKDSKQIILQDVVGPLPFSVISHNYPGQEYDGDIKYVEKIHVCPKCLEEVTYPSLNIHWCQSCGEYTAGETDWQEVEEPEEALIDYSLNTGDEVRQELSTNPLYTQFQEDKKKAKIIAEIRTH